MEAWGLLRGLGFGTFCRLQCKVLERRCILVFSIGEGGVAGGGGRGAGLF